VEAENESRQLALRQRLIRELAIRYNPSIALGSLLTHDLGIRVRLSPPSDQRLPRARKRGRVSMEEYQKEPMSSTVAVNGCCQKNEHLWHPAWKTAWRSIAARFL
jgi:hypothetical protein